MGKPKFPETHISPDHPDFAILSRIRDGIYAKLGGKDRLKEELPGLIKNAVDFVIDPERTLRTKISDLDKVEKTFIGLKIEHYLRDWLGVHAYPLSSGAILCNMSANTELGHDAAYP